VRKKLTKATKEEEEVKFTFLIVRIKKSKLRKNFRNSGLNYPISLKTPDPSLGTQPISQPWVLLFLPASKGRRKDSARSLTISD
jgi:hypothetical protein